MNFLKSLGGFVGASAATGGLPYVLDPPSGPVDAPELHPLPDFQLFAGHARADASHAVSVFKSRQPASQLTQNALKRIKTLRHPNILAFVDGTEVPNNGPIVLVTEPVIPLAQYLEDLRREYGATSDEFQMSVSWGLRSVLLALQFITVDCKLLHGRVNPQSIFVTKGGDWKLGGFELTGELTSDGPSYIFTAFEQFADGNYKAPEWQRREWKNIGNAPSSAVDVWSFACLLFYIFNDSQLRPNELSSASNIPHALRMQYRKAVEADPRRRPTPDKFLASTYFDTPFIKRMDFLENLAVKTPEEKVEFYKDLCSHLNTLPQSFGVHKVLPALKGVVEFGAATAAKNGPVKLDPSASHMLPAMVQIGSSLSAEEFKEQVLPIIIKLFSCNDRAVRVQLLQMMEKFAVHFDAKLVNSPVIFDNICSGFTDAAPVLRELTVKSMLHIADKLSDANLNQRVMKYFAKLQTDPEPAIRTNTTICLGRLASKLNDATRPKVLFPAFSRALRDPFPHARLAGLRSLTACEELFSPQAMAGSIVPAIAPLLLDVSISVREQATISMDLFMKKVMAEAAAMKTREEEQAREQKLRQEVGGSDEHIGATGSSTSSAPSSTGGGGGYASSLTSWAASAVVSNVGKIVGGGSASSTPAPLSNSSSTSASFSSSTPSASAFHSTQQATSYSHQQSTSSTSNAFASDDFGDDEDAWGEDDDLDGLGSPQAPVKTASFTTTTTPSWGSTPTYGGNNSFSSSSSSTSGMKLSVARPAPTPATSVSSSNGFAAEDAGGWGDDNWGGNDLDVDTTTTTKTSSSAFATTSSTTFGSTSAPGSQTSSFGTAARTSSGSGSSGLNVSAAVTARKTASERLAEAKAKRDSGATAMKLTATKKGDEWDDWNF
ncbi:hypothetical protein Poli38472_004257 [Pythium oligandrum]|uniref:Protein kinase domain-containing protein n=1 Tax=Pythium oligandrum TaxID=41045 RepID=A0A8K1CPY0_PYTOL|nr:hypothetical protein Poli38472_004257 [Pythium oligandrum]|eukprot:TMW66492.1 hypothetical protein Poli38472_004257 [Pythium oligandrum]